MADRILARLFFPLTTKDDMGPVLDVIEAEDLLKASHFGFDERQREPYIRGEIDARSLHAVGSLHLWRTTRPKYAVMLSRWPWSINALDFDISDKLTTDDIRLLFEALERLAVALHVEWGGALIAWNGTQGGDNYAVTVKVKELYECGLFGVAARNWFGRMLTDRLDRELIASAGEATDLGDGLLRLDLVRDPWTASYETLLARHREARSILATSGMMADLTRRVMPKPGPKWTAPPWRLRAKDRGSK